MASIVKVMSKDPIVNRIQDNVRDTVNPLVADLAAAKSTMAQASAVQVIRHTASGAVAFDAAAASHFVVTLAANATSSTITGVATGQVLTFVIQQDGTGSRTFVWPTRVNGDTKTEVRGEGVIGSTASTASVQRFIFDGTTLWALGAILTGI